MTETDKDALPWQSALAQATARRQANAGPLAARARQLDEQYERLGLARRDNVRRLRLADRLPPELGGPRLPTDADLPAALAATRDHLKAVGLWGPASEHVLAELRQERRAS